MLTYYLSLYVIGIFWCQSTINKVIENDYLEKQGSPISTSFVKVLICWTPIFNLIMAALCTWEIIESKLIKRKQALLKKKIKKLRSECQNKEVTDILDKTLDLLN